MSAERIDMMAIERRIAAIRSDPAIAYVGMRWGRLEIEEQAAVRSYVSTGRLTWENRSDGETYVISAPGAQS